MYVALTFSHDMIALRVLWKSTSQKGGNLEIDGIHEAALNAITHSTGSGNTHTDTLKQAEPYSVEGSLVSCVSTPIACMKKGRISLISIEHKFGN